MHKNIAAELSLKQDKQLKELIQLEDALEKAKSEKLLIKHDLLLKDLQKSTSKK
jgi:hypothetical protein